MKSKKSIQLLHDYLYGKPGLEQKARVDKWYESIDDAAINEKEDLSAVKQQIYEGIRAELETGSKTIPLYNRTFFRAAAAILLISLTAVYFWMQKKSNDTDTAGKQQQTPTDVAAPAGNRAILTLADGTMIVLDSVVAGAVAKQGNTQIAKLDDGRIAYNTDKLTTAVMQYNTLRVPKGSRPMQLQLADGTEVWLNVASSIRYPTAFTGAERVVEITGEAYFEVAHNKKMPFKVKKDDVEVLVLGTHFNVNTYEDEEALKVTLLEGAVNVYRRDGESKRILPGQQAAVRPGLATTGAINVLNGIDTDEVMAWKNGWFNFNSLQVTGIMRQIEKWYDVEVNYQGEPGTKHFSGIVSRQNNVSEVLKIMEPAGFRFKIEGKKITVMQKQ